MLLGMAIGTNAQTVSVADIEALPGETVTATLNFKAPEDTYEGVYLEMQFPATGFATNAISGFGIPQIGEMNEGFVKITTADSKSFTEAQLQVEFSVATDVELGAYAVTVTNIQFMNSVDKVGIDDVTFTVNVVSAHTVVLDENATEAPAAAEGVNVTVKRTLAAGEWSTICLPFAMTAEQAEAAFGAGVQIADFAGYEYDEESGKMTVNFNSVTAIEANRPYLIKAAADVTEFTVEGVDIAPSDDLTVAAVKRTKKAWSEMTGTYAVATVEESSLYLTADGLHYSDGTAEVKAFSAFFDFYDEVEDAASIAIAIDGVTIGADDAEKAAAQESLTAEIAAAKELVGEGESDAATALNEAIAAAQAVLDNEEATTEELNTALAALQTAELAYQEQTATGISNIISVAPDEGIYTLAGQRVNAATKGLYIINGKKVVK